MTTETDAPPPAEGETYRILEELDRLEELMEEMDALHVSTQAEAEQRLARLNARLDEIAGG